MPDSPGHFFARQGAGKGGTTRRFGRKNLIAFLMILIEEWHRKHPDFPVPLGDLAEEDGSHQKDHATHDDGFAVDIFNLHLLPGKHKGPPYRLSGHQNPFYGRDKTIELARDIAAKKPIFSMIAVYHNDPELRDEVNTQFPLRPPITHFAKHEDHIHVSLHDNTSLTPEQIDSILGLNKLAKLVDKALDELLATGQMLVFGAHGTLVTALQTVLNAAGTAQGTTLPPLQPDGAFGPKTKGRVQEFQSQNKLASDGIVGPKTKQALASNV
ncbi:peptidoglycan-binding domain-containing protein [Roseibium salinum]|uniref:Peptidoglycan-binding domain-containing protein n=1 Tax=Roseibium salinum TaxID=1604349 RepID=A0ABT3QZ26_9HYPH|nr:peptidoglycan-binding domain-containing protein [Roseibium sp. DSM 29163]MCX2722093.1 peptidoglycan-binding domain-containing protein [Roseibium sp. DSM 29163]